MAWMFGGLSLLWVGVAALDFSVGFAAAGAVALVAAGGFALTAILAAGN